RYAPSASAPVPLSQMIVRLPRRRPCPGTPGRPAGAARPPRPAGQDPVPASSRKVPGGAGRQRFRGKYRAALTLFEADHIIRRRCFNVMAESKAILSSDKSAAPAAALSLLCVLIAVQVFVGIRGLWPYRDAAAAGSTAPAQPGAPASVPAGSSASQFVIP